MPLPLESRGAGSTQFLVQGSPVRIAREDARTAPDLAASIIFVHCRSGPLAFD
jgi:hypothetical protein